MGLVVAPIKEGKVDEWKSWSAELSGEKRSEFTDLNKRHGLTRHDVWLAETPAGAMAVVIHEGPGSDTFMQNVAQSENSFDVWMKESIEDLHGMDMGAPPPGPMPVKVL
ncbi:MAG: hypothetical protein HQ522_06935 [Bacteroidetes bacterium]|nr:hypothetical protein [Bacteroidota bacterium]